MPTLRNRFLGVSLERICADIAAEQGRDCPEDFAGRFESRLFARYATELRPMDGAEALLAHLREEGFALAIATGGSLRRMDETLRVAGLAQAFAGRAFSADEVAEGKPAPDLVLHAAERIATPPAACVVVEDSPHGVRGAVAAGMRAVGFTGGSHLEGMRPDQADRLRDAGAEAVFETLAEIGAHLGRARAAP